MVVADYNNLAASKGAADGSMRNGCPGVSQDTELLFFCLAGVVSGARA
jgi:hypothetical protein